MSFPIYDDGTIDCARVFCRIGWYSFAQQILQESDNIISTSDAALLIYEIATNNSLRLLEQDRFIEVNHYLTVKREQYYSLLQYLRISGAGFSALWILPSGEHISSLPRMLGNILRLEVQPELHRIVRQVAGSGEHSFSSTIAEVTCLETTFEDISVSATQVFFGEFCMADVCKWLHGMQWQYVNSSNHSRIFIVADKMQPSGSPVELSSNVKGTPWQYMVYQRKIPKSLWRS